jgi:transposase
MSGFRTPEQPREQIVLWSQRLDDALPSDHPVRLVVEVFESAAFTSVFQEWARDYVLVEGRPPYHPRDLTALYIYGMMNRIRSSRQLEGACYNRIDVRWLMSGQTPDHSTIAAFVTDHAKRLRQVFKEVVVVAKRAGLVKLEQVAVDGTKIEADAGRGSVHRESTIVSELVEVEAQIEALEQEWEANEKREANLFGDEVPWTPTGSGTNQQRKARLEDKRNRLEDALAAINRRRQEIVGGPEPKPIASTTDPDGRAMKDKKGRSEPNYNAQAASDAAQGVIVAQEVNDHPEDSGMLVPMLEQTQENCGQLPAEASADSQYNTGPDLNKLEQMGVVGYLPDSGKPSGISQSAQAVEALAAAQTGQVLSDEQWNALPKNGDGHIDRSAFRYDREANVYRCPMGQGLGFVRTSQKELRCGTAIRTQYGECTACASCPRAAMCCKNPVKGRIINRDQYEDCRERVRERMASPVGRERYRLRGRTIEPRFGFIKHGLGIRRFMRRGLAGVRAEFSLICTVVNIGILLGHWSQVETVL